MNSLVLSGTAALVLSRTRSSCYQGPESGEYRDGSTAYPCRNVSNLDSFGIFLTSPPKTGRWGRTEHGKTARTNDRPARLDDADRKPSGFVDRDPPNDPIGVSVRVDIRVDIRIRIVSHRPRLSIAIRDGPRQHKRSKSSLSRLLPDSADARR